jgi:hypothetical protein
MRLHRVSCSLLLECVLGIGVVISAQELSPKALSNWAAPPMWTPPAVEVEEVHVRGMEGIRPIRVQTDLTGPLPFIAVTPCRVVDTRGPNGPFGGPIFGIAEARTYALSTNPACPGFPAASTIQGYSLNITVTQTAGAGFVTGFPSGTSLPVVSTVNFTSAGQSLSNAAIVPAGSGGNAGKIDIYASQQTHVIVDINGYYAGSVVTSIVAGTGITASPASGAVTVGIANGGVGLAQLSPAGSTSGQVLQSSGSAVIWGDASNLNTANALVRRDGSGNFTAGTVTLSGDLTLGGILTKGSGLRLLHTTGSFNIFVGAGAGNLTTSGVGNNAVLGADAMTSNTTGNNAAVLGADAFASNTTGNTGTAIGAGALKNNTTGNNNIGLGANAGVNLTTENNNIDIGNAGVVADSGTIRIGTNATHTKFFAYGVRGTMTTVADGQPVLIDSMGQLGTISSSAAVKRDISDVGEASAAVLRLRPVSFFYRNDSRGILQYGLIADEVAKVMPEIVQFSASGEPETVRYHFLTPLLLNEVQKQQQVIEAQREEINQLAARLSRLEEKLNGPTAHPSLSATK